METGQLSAHEAFSHLVGSSAGAVIRTAHKVEPRSPTEVGTGMIAINKVWPNVTGAFQRNCDKNVNLYFQVYNLMVDGGTKKPSAMLEIALTRNNQEVKKIIEPSSDLANAGLK